MNTTQIGMGSTKGAYRAVLSGSLSLAAPVLKMCSGPIIDPQARRLHVSNRNAMIREHNDPRDIAELVLRGPLEDPDPDHGIG